jgi:hypothetical protein
VSTWKRAAGLLREQPDDLGPAALDDVGRAQEQGLLLRGRQLGPGREGGGGRVDRAGRVGAGARGDAGHHGAPVRVKVVEQRVRTGPFAADVLPVLAHQIPPACRKQPEG